MGEFKKMSGPSLDLEKPNAIGGLDRLVTNFAISLIAVYPTFWTCIVKPWRLTPLLERDDPDGRMGILLAPGAFLPLALMISFIIAAVLATPETLSTNGSFIGPGLAVAVQTAAAEGDIWKIIATVMPVYGTAIVIGLLGTVLKPWAHKDWTLRASLRASFYVITVLISWMILTTAIVDLVRLHTDNFGLGSLLFKLLIPPAFIFLVWAYFWFFRHDGALSWIRSGLLSLAMFGLIFTPFFVIDLLMRLTSS